MSTQWPKLPTGPSSPGSAKVRMLNRAGGKWQTSRPTVGTVAKRSGDFRRVTTSGDGYLSFGYTGTKQSAFTSTTLEPPCLSFRPWLSKGVEVGDVAQLGRGLFVMSHAFGYVTSSLQTYVYTDGISPRSADVVTLENSVAFIQYNYYAKSPENYVVTVGTTMPTYIDDQPIMGIVPPCVCFLGSVDVATGDDPVDAVMSAYPVLSSRVDQQGRKRNDIEVSVMPSGAPAAYSFTIDPTSFADSKVEFAQYMPSIATENHAVVFAKERHYDIKPGGVVAGDEYAYPRKLWALKFVDKDLSAITAHDLTSVLLDEQATSAGFTLWAPWFYTTHHDECMAFHMRTVALPNNTVLLSYYYFIEDQAAVADPLPLPEIGSSEGLVNRQAYCCIAKINLASMTASVTYKVPCYIKWIFNPADVAFLIPDFPQLVIGGMTHIGEGEVIAKIVDGLQPPKSSWDEASGNALLKVPGTETLRFLRSIDAGATWTEFSPLGLPEPFEHGRFGDITVHKPKTADKPAVLMVNAWTGTAYRTYVSKDSGATWKKAGVIASSSTFRRLDGIWRATSGLFLPSKKDTGSFRHLLDGANGELLADRTIPDRFTYKP